MPTSGRRHWKLRPCGFLLLVRVVITLDMSANLQHQAMKVVIPHHFLQSHLSASLLNREYMFDSINVSVGRILNSDG
jgi:hypothetical protein